MEAYLDVRPREVLELVVGEGGYRGQYGGVVGDNSSDGKCGEAPGGTPGGGKGYGGNPYFACGGGGGCSSLSRRINGLLEVLLIVGGTVA